MAIKVMFGFPSLSYFISMAFQFCFMNIPLPSTISVIPVQTFVAFCSRVAGSPHLVSQLHLSLFIAALSCPTCPELCSLPESLVASHRPQRSIQSSWRNL